MSKEIDWSQAPEGYPFWCEAIDPKDSHLSDWHRKDERGDFIDQKGRLWYASNENRYYRVYSRPEAATWSGEGLPPVGTVCEYRWGGECRQAEIIAHWMAPADLVAVYVPLEDGVHSTECGRAIANAFRPLRTPEQIAAEEREAAIADMTRVISSKVADRRAAESLYELGYRKVKQP